MKKRLVAVLLAGAMVCSLAACGSDKKESGSDKKKEVSLSVVTTYAGEDGNVGNYKDAIKAFTKETGIEIKDGSATSDEAFKARVETDFQTGSEPDVLFFFTGADANSFIEEGKVVSLEEIQKEYSDYASNMDESKIPDSLVDGKKYSVPSNGYWEGLFYNEKVLKDCGVEVPGTDYTWDQFLKDCKTIREKGYDPIAAALGNIPHYWWEYSIFNHTGPEKHLEIPTSVDEGNGPGWVKGMEDIKALYEQNAFPENTLSATDDETFAAFTSGKAAFLLDGSWKVGGISEAVDEETLKDFGVTFVPGNESRKATDLIGGISMGYYITKKAWDDTDKRDAAVKFVQYMTSDEMTGKFAQHAATALKTAPEVSGLTSLQEKAVEMITNYTSLTGAAQDIFKDSARVSTFDGMPKIVTGEVSAKDAVAEGLKAYSEMNQ